MRFALKAMDSAHQVVALDLDAGDDAGARREARRRGLAVISIRRKGRALLLRRTAAFPATLFSIELAALLDAGLNIVEALNALAEKAPPGRQREVLAGLLEALHRGESFSAAIAGFPQAFSPLYVATIRSSERTGDVKEALARYIAYQEELDRVRKKILSALLYPAILAVVGVLVLGFLVFYVVPRFARVYEEVSTDLPFFSGLLLTAGGWVERNGPVALVAAAVALSVAAYALCKERVRAALVERLWRTPSLGERMRVYQLARLYRTVGMLLRAGIPAVKAFEMVSGLLAPNLRAQLEKAVTLLKEGAAISAALSSTGLATPIAARMMVVGERSGRMGDLMDRSARFCDDETARFVDAFTRVFEPVLMAVLGVAVGAIVVLMYMPVFELAGSIR
jgi:general secretion pathway protein F